MNPDSRDVVTLSPTEAGALVETRVTCPFVGSAVAEGRLAVRNSADNPIASLEELRALGDSGGGDLGQMLVLFALGNHALMRGDAGALDSPAPVGLFSLEFPGSQGAHAGHSGILLGDPRALASGRLSLPDFARLVNRARDGWLRRSDVARFMAENLRRDPVAKVFGLDAVASLAVDLAELAVALATPLFAHPFQAASGAERAVIVKFTKLLGADNLTGSAGEFGLLFALLAHRPGAIAADGDPALAVGDLEAMFVRKRLPPGFDAWPKRRHDWVQQTLALATEAARFYLTEPGGG